MSNEILHHDVARHDAQSFNLYSSIMRRHLFRNLLCPQGNDSLPAREVKLTQPILSHMAFILL